MPIIAKTHTHSYIGRGHVHFNVDSPKGNRTNILLLKYTTCEYPSSVSSSSFFIEETNQNLKLKINKNIK